MYLSLSGVLNVDKLGLLLEVFQVVQESFLPSCDLLVVREVVIHHEGDDKGSGCIEVIP